jgi:hypothetical protein
MTKSTKIAIKMGIILSPLSLKTKLNGEINFLIAVISQQVQNKQTK